MSVVGQTRRWLGKASMSALPSGADNTRSPRHQCRRVATRYDKTANHLAFVKLASIRIWVGANESTPYYTVRTKIY
jgi:hypothetical protein